MQKLNLLLVSLACLASGCTTPPIGRNPSSDKSSMEQRLREFDFKISNEILEQDISKGKNTFISPFVLREALSLVVNGAKGSTGTQILSTMNLRAGELDDLNRYNENFVNSMNQRIEEYKKGDYEKSAPFDALFANSVWYKGDVVLEKPFKSVLDNVYKATFSELEGNPDRSANAINNWASAKTNNLVKKIIEPDVIADPDFKMLLASLVYVKGSWTKEFRLKPEPMPFKRFGKDSKIQFMERTERSKVFETDEFTAVELPTAGDIASFTIVMPKKSANLYEFNAQRATVFRSEFWETLDQSMQSQSVYLTMPKFEVGYSNMLNDYLKKVGMTIPFDQMKADFSGITKSMNLHISYVREDAKLKVNEKGFEAAAVVSIAMATRSARIDRPVEVTIDRPFFLAIRDTKTKTLLFLGAVSDLH